MRKAHLFNQENKMKLINQQLYKRRRIAFKKLRIQQLQQQQQPINININTGFETNRRIKEIYKKLELLTPQERITPTPIQSTRENIERTLERKKQAEEKIKQQKEALKQKNQRIKELQEVALMINEDMIGRDKEEELYNEEFETELMGKEDKKKKTNLRELVLMNLNDKSSNSLFG